MAIVARSVVHKRGGDQERINLFLRKHGLDSGRVWIVEHDAYDSFNNARDRPHRSFSERVFFRLLPSQFGFCELEGDVVHVAKKAGLITRLHETVHAVDFTAETQFKELVGRAVSKFREIRLADDRGFIECIMDIVEAFRLSAILEGRAIYCERKAREDTEFSPGEKREFALARNVRKIAFASYLAVMACGFRIASNISETTGFAAATLKTACGLAAIGGLVKMAGRLHYLIGDRFMQKAGKFFETTQETLRMTAEQPPTLAELFMPGRYLKRVSRNA